jgi:hypothetical protein
MPERMRDDLIKEQLMGYANDAAREALQPGTAEIYRRARRRRRRVAALSVTGVLLVAGAAVGYGLRGTSPIPSINRPRPPVTSQVPNPLPRLAPPRSFVTVIEGGAGADSSDLAVVSAATGEPIRSLAPATTHAYSVSQDRAWVYFLSNSPSWGIYRVPYDGGTVEKVTETSESSALALSPDGSKVVWEVVSGNRSGLWVRDLIKGTERLLLIPGPVSGADAVNRGSWVWNPDSRHVAMVVTRGLTGVRAGLEMVDVVTGRWRHMLDFDGRDGRDGGLRGCCGAMAWPAGSERIAFVQGTPRDPANPGSPLENRLVYVDPTTGAATPGIALPSGPNLDLYRLDFDPSGTFMLIGGQDAHSVTTWWSGGGKPVKVRQVRLGDHVPVEVAGASVGGQW